MTAWDPVPGGREAFLACLWAQCAPGRVHGPLPAAGVSRDPDLDAAAAVLLALLDPGLTLAHAGDPNAGSVAGEVRSITGAGDAPVTEADFVLVVGGADQLVEPVAASARRGTAADPEHGATIVYCVPQRRTRALVAGPGIDGTAWADIPLDRRELAALTVANSAPPAGVDAFLVVAGSVLALPRSTAVQIQAA
jgi:alpha-D-ribose 1-methylphosphonate 5-triphosphate synthase subunit PhnH